MSVLLDQFIPKPDKHERHQTLVRAPADLVLEVARNFDLQSVPLVHAIFWLRNKLLRATKPPPARGMGLVALTQSIGWGVLIDEPGAYVSGAACQPWVADVVFSAIPVEQFATYSEPDLVKIVWSIETEAIELWQPMRKHTPNSIDIGVSSGSESLWSGGSYSLQCVVRQNASGARVEEANSRSREVPSNN